MKTVNISAAKSVVGTQLKFDKNGDILSKDITILYEGLFLVRNVQNCDVL